MQTVWVVAIVLWAIIILWFTLAKLGVIKWVRRKLFPKNSVNAEGKSVTGKFSQRFPDTLLFR